MWQYIIPAAISGLGTYMGYASNQKANSISASNYQMQKEELDYQHQLQQQIFEREDTGYQRAVADARAAGLSAASVSSPSSAGGVVSTTAPQQQNDSTTSFELGLNALNNLTSVLGNINQLKIQDKLANSEIAKKAAETSKTIAEVDDMRLRNPITMDILRNQLFQSNLDKKFNTDTDYMRYRKAYWDYQDDLNKFMFNNYFGTHSGMTQFERMLQVSGILEGKPTMYPTYALPYSDINNKESYEYGFGPNMNLSSRKYPKYFSPKPFMTDLFGKPYQYEGGKDYYKEKYSNSLNNQYWSLILKALGGL